MKKFVYFVSLLWLSLTATAGVVVESLDQLSPTKAYTLYNSHFTTYAIYSPTHSDQLVWTAGMTGDVGHAVKNPSYSEPFDATDRNGAWMFVEYSDDGVTNSWYVYNIGAQKFLKVGESSNGVNQTKLQLPLAVEVTMNNSLATFLSVRGNRNYMCVAPQLDIPISVWSADDAGTQWQIAESDEVTVTDEDYNTCMQMLEQYVPKKVSLSIDTRCGNIFASSNGGALPSRVEKDRAFTFSAHALKGFELTDGITIRHGKNINGPQYVEGERQWSEYTIEATSGNITIPADSVDGDILIKAYWEQTSYDGYELVFSDEFNGQGEPATDKWMRTRRQNATWNRWCSNSPLVVMEGEGTLHCLAIPNPDKTADNVDMLTGGIQSYFGFRYGRAEARIKTRQHTGNFPAFWMMPVDNSKGWPNAGEIDIWETIDNQTLSHHTVHTNWTYNLHKGGNTQTKSGIDYDCWHVYTVDWNDKQISWYVDGQYVWTYNKSTDTNALNQGQWPFDAPFYLILNQSVGNGAWAAPADINFTYETEFDWVRVYQPTEITGVEEAQSFIPTKQPAIYDLWGNPVAKPVQGLYVVDGKKTYIK